MRARAREIQTSAGIPYNLALQVARGERTLSDVLNRLMAEDRVAQLVKKHDLPRSLATQVALGQADLDAVLEKRELDAHLTKYKDKSVLVDRAADGMPVGLALHGQRNLRGVIQSVDLYEFRFKPDDAAEAETVHKLQAKYAWAPDDYKTVRKGIEPSKDGRKAAEPIWKPQDRYPCSDKRLFACHKAEKAVTVVTLEGDALRGRITWVGRWEMGMVLKGGGTVTVFRHAIKLLEEN